MDYSNATHVLKCAHAIGRSRREYLMRCHVLKTTRSGKLKIQVYGSRDWSDMRHISKIRYVDATRVSKINTPTGE